MRDIIKEEAEIVFDCFNNEDAWRLGCLLVDMARERKAEVVISIEKAGQLVFQYAFAGTCPDNDRWVAGKRRVSNLILHSSIGLRENLKGAGVEVLGLDPQLYFAAGGSVPILVKNTGYIGNVVVSGMSDDEDHDFVLEGIKKYLGR